MKKILTTAIIVFSLNAFSQGILSKPQILFPTLNPALNYQTDISGYGFPSIEAFANLRSKNETKLKNLTQESVIQIIDSIYYWELDTLLPGMKRAGKIFNMVYNDNNKLASYLNQKWNGSAWVNLQQCNTTYDVNNNPLSSIYQNWDGSTWLNSIQVTNSYDANKNISYTLSYKWDGSSWVDTELKNNAYDNNNNCTCTISQYLEGNSWINARQNIYTYNSNNCINTLSQAWDGSAWQTLSQDNNTYNTSNNRIKTVHQIWGAGYWVDMWSINYDYDGNSNQVSAEYQSWKGRDWIKSITINKTYDVNNYQLSYLHKIWNKTGTKTTNADSSYTYFHAIITGLDELSAVPQGISIYPNPATDKITFSSNSIIPGEILIRITSMNGQLIKQATFQNQKQYEMNVNTLAKGIYLVKIQTYAGVETKKLVIQ